MRYSEGHGVDTRRRIVQTASREFRRKGGDSISVADVMKAEGLTVGGFYRHFKGKESLLIEAVDAALHQVADQVLQIAGDLPRHQALKRVIDFYLSEEHMAHPQSGCAFAALGAEMARYPKRCRARIVGALDQYRLKLQFLLPGKTEAERSAGFDVLFPAMAGCLTASRVQTDPERSKQILHGARSFFVAAYCGESSDSKEKS